ncbi:MAG TPA: energy transducer TonB [Pyrinomonadaceae bacterium]|nr:energy transducer TonB [Pyrinomonadaceae bacterium]
MLNPTKLTLLALLAAASLSPAHASAQTRPLAHAPASLFLFQSNEREQDGLAGPVRRVKTETAKITTKQGRPVEGPRVLLESATYDIKGAKLDHAYFLAAGGSLTGKEVYRYDDRGNIVEMTLHNADGSLLAKETYSYELDAVGNWTKMVTSVAVIEGGKMSFEPTEVTYRTISYFLDEATVAKMSGGAAPNAAAPAPAAATPSAATPNASSDAKSNASLQPKSAPAVAEKAAAKKAAPESKSSAASLPAASVDKPSMAAAAPSMSAAKSSDAPVVKADGDAPARPVAKGPLKPISGGILNGKAVSLPPPVYPEIAKRARAAGQVSVEVVIDVTGKVISAKAVGGPTLLQEAAVKAALSARFSPTLLSGQPVKVSGTITYNFSLAQ